MMQNLPIKFHQNPMSGEGAVLKRFYDVKPLIWIISLWSHPTVILFLKAHLHIISNLPIKFHQNPLSGLREVALTRF